MPPSLLVSCHSHALSPCDESPPAFVFEAVEEDGRAGGADDLIEEERTPAADEAKVQDIEEEGSHERAQEGDGEERIASHLCGLARSAQDAR